MATRNLADMGNRTHAQYVKTAVQQLPNGRNNLHVLHTRCVLQWISKFQPHLFGKNWTINSMIFGGAGGFRLSHAVYSSQLKII